MHNTLIIIIFVCEIAYVHIDPYRFFKSNNKMNRITMSSDYFCFAIVTLFIEQNFK